VSASPTRRRFTVAYKLQVVTDAAGCTAPGAVAALLRREGLYSSHLAAWRAAARRGELAGPAPRRRGPAPVPPDPGTRRIAELERQLAAATVRAEQAEAIVAVQKKVAALLDQLRPPPSGAPTGPR